MREREKCLPVQPTRASPPEPAQLLCWSSTVRPSPPPPPCRLPPRASRQRRDTARAPELATPPPCSSASSGHRDAARHLLGAAPTPLDPLALFLSLVSLLCFLSLSLAERSRSRATVTPRPPSPPRPLAVLASSASTLSSSPPIHSPPEALHRRPCRRSPPRPPEIVAVDSLHSGRPRAH